MIANEPETLEYSRRESSRRSTLFVIAALVCALTFSYCVVACLEFAGILRVTKTEFALGALMGVGAILIAASSLLLVTFVGAFIMNAVRSRRRLVGWILVGVLQVYAVARAFNYFDELLKRAI